MAAAAQPAAPPAPQRAGRERPGVFPPGEVVAEIVSRVDPTQRYAVYMPSTSRPERGWPVLFLMDPRGRALVPLELFRPAAEQYGYVLVSSYNTRSDVDFDAVTPALQAMLMESQRLVSVDPQRFYLAGMSGTARTSWFHARQLDGHVAGVFGAGAGLLPREPPPRDPHFVFFGAVGDLDFNYEELQQLKDDLTRSGVRHRLSVFDGGHRWPPGEVSTEAIEWLELEAMLAGLRPRDQGLIDSLYVRAVDRAARSASAGDVIDAFARYGAVVSDFESLRVVDEALARARELSTNPELGLAARRRLEITAEHQRFVERFRGILAELDTGDGVPNERRLLGAFGISALQARAADDSDRLGALAAQRQLELVFTHMSFYQPERLLRQGRPERALAVVRVADAIKPDHPRVLVQLARVHAALGHDDLAAQLRLRAGQIAPLLGHELLDDPFFFDPVTGEPLIATRPRQQ